MTASDPSSTPGRLIFVSDQEFQDWSYAVDVANLDVIEKACDPLLQRYRDSPPDPVEAVLEAICDTSASVHERELAAAVLVALGWEPAHETGDTHA